MKAKTTGDFNSFLLFQLQTSDCWGFDLCLSTIRVHVSSTGIELHTEFNAMRKAHPVLCESEQSVKHSKINKLLFHQNMTLLLSCDKWVLFCLVGNITSCPNCTSLLGKIYFEDCVHAEEKCVYFIL